MINELKGYRWPASALSDREMEILYHWRRKTGTPISHLIKQAIIECDAIIITGRILGLPGKGQQ